MNKGSTTQRGLNLQIQLYLQVSHDKYSITGFDFFIKHSMEQFKLNHWQT